VKYNIAAFTHIGTQREINQDRILVQDTLLEEGYHYVEDAQNCFCFLADGIGGGPSGEFAAQFVLEQVRKRISPVEKNTKEELSDTLSSINNELITFGCENPKYRGTGTTLVGIIINDDEFHVINAGDSPAYVFRNNSMIKITEDQVFDPYEENSPITSYFGGKNNELHLDFDTVLRDILAGDILLFASDGLLKSLSIKQIKVILSNSKPLNEKSEFILRKALEIGSEDNISCIFIEVVE